MAARRGAGVVVLDEPPTPTVYNEIAARAEDADVVGYVQLPTRGRPRTLLAVPCDTHGAGPCPSRKGCANRRARAGLPPAKSGTTGHQRGHPERKKRQG